ncbi:HIG1 domain family member 2A, mitochondrial isoform X1 [Arvicanthis niloticus]|uniref:HIG1 domain family member 2A, mitochondrial isoform X1 n=1 Tax=Arvicanthis niloticus TaxID=61156 RepID=UPI00402B6E7A
MAAPGPVNPEAPFDPSKAPVIEGFSPTVYTNPEGFKEKFIRKTRENPMVPIGDPGSCSRRLHFAMTMRHGTAGDRRLSRKEHGCSSRGSRIQEANSSTGWGSGDPEAAGPNISVLPAQVEN